MHTDRFYIIYSLSIYKLCITQNYIHIATWKRKKYKIMAPLLCAGCPQILFTDLKEAKHKSKMTLTLKFSNKFRLDITCSISDTKKQNDNDYLPDKLIQLKLNNKKLELPNVPQSH